MSHIAFGDLVLACILHCLLGETGIRYFTLIASVLSSSIFPRAILLRMSSIIIGRDRPFTKTLAGSQQFPFGAHVEAIHTHESTQEIFLHIQHSNAEE